MGEMNAIDMKDISSTKIMNRADHGKQYDEKWKLEGTGIMFDKYFKSGGQKGSERIVHVHKNETYLMRIFLASIIKRQP